MPSYSRIISAEELGDDVEPFAIGSIGPSHPQDAQPQRMRAVVQPSGVSEDGLRRSFEQGFRKGVAAGREAVHREVLDHERAIGATLRQRTEHLVDALAQELQRFEQHAAEQVMALAMEVARQVVRTEVACHPETVLPVIREALAQLGEDTAPATLLLHPVDLPFVQQNLAALLSQRTLHLVPDASVGLAGCRLVSPMADIDAGIETRWQRTLASMGYRDASPLGPLERAPAAGATPSADPGESRLDPGDHAEPRPDLPA